MQTVYKEDLESVRFLVEAGADINALDGCDTTALWIAARWGLE
jgi:ankyrin repeat protein